MVEAGENQLEYYYKNPGDDHGGSDHSGDHTHGEKVWNFRYILNADQWNLLFLSD